MSGDRLAQIERRLQACAEDVRGRPFSHPIGVGWYAEDVLALVEIAKAARHLIEWADNKRGTDFGEREWIEARQALARLDLALIEDRA